MFRYLFSTLVAVYLITSSPLVRALPIMDPPAVERGGTTTAMADFGVSGAGFFDLLLNVPNTFKLLRIFDDDSDGGLATYNRWLDARYYGFFGGIIFDPSNTFPSSTFADGGFPYGLLGIRVTGGSPSGFDKIKLEFEALSMAPLGENPIGYWYDVDGNDSLDWLPATFNIRVVESAEAPEPYSLVLILSGLLTLFAVRRRRRV